MQENSRFAFRIATTLPVNPMPIPYMQISGFKRLNRRI
jgi:hypothetical protein